MATPVKKKLPTPPKKIAAKAPTGSAKPAAKKASTYVPPKPLPVAAKLPEKKAPDKVVGIGHNGGPVSISKQKLKALVDKIENLEEDKSGISDDIKEVYTSAKGEGFDVKTIRKLVAMRRRDKEALKAEKEMLDLYLEALDPELAEVLS